MNDDAMQAEPAGAQITDTQQFTQTSCRHWGARGLSKWMIIRVLVASKKEYCRQTCGENFAYPGMFAKFAVTVTVISLL